MGNDDDLIGKWCVLRTAAPRTLLLAKALNEAGVEAWTPVEIVKRAGRGRDRHKPEERPAPITPTFVFVPAVRSVEMAIAARAPFSPYPPFSLLRRRDRCIALIRDAGLNALRKAEDAKRKTHLKGTRKTIATGSRVKLTEGPFAGMTGIVEQGNGKAALVNFGAGFVVSIASYILTDGVIQTVNKPEMGIAA